MKLTISKSELQSSLAGPARIASGAMTAELACVKLEASDGSLSFEATDGDRSMKLSAAALVDKPGAALLPARRLLDTVKTLPDEAVEVSVSSGSAAVKCGKSVFRLPALGTLDFPGFPEVEPEQTLAVPHFLFAEMAKTVLPFAAKDGVKSDHPILQGVHVELDGGTLRMVATDSFHVGCTEFKVDACGEFSTVLPAGFVSEAVSSECQGDAVISSSARQAKMEFGGVTIASRLVEGRFPGWRRLVPETIDSRAVFDKGEVMGAIRMCSAASGGKMPITIAYDGGTSTFSCADDEGSAVSHIDCECEGAGSVKCSIKMLEDAVRAVDSDEVAIGLTGSLQPMIVTGGTCLNVVMPMR